MITSITRKILNWSEEKFEEIQNDQDAKHPYLKSFGLGILDGAIDSAVIIGSVVITGCIVEKVVNSLKNNS